MGRFNPSETKSDWLLNSIKDMTLVTSVKKEKGRTSIPYILSNHEIKENIIPLSSKNKDRGAQRKHTSQD
jgi:hypothetical protein